MTHPRRRAYRPRPTVRAHPRSLAAALALAALACSSQPQTGPGPLNRLTFPSSVAVRGQDLLVVSTNFDLLYSEQEGGSVLTLSLPAGAPGGVNIGSLGGEIAIADAAACGLPNGQTLALVPSRSTTALYRLALGADGIPTCGPGCALPLRADLADPYGVTVACRPGGPNRVFVSHLRTPDLVGYVTMFPLDPNPGLWQPQVQIANVGPDPTRSFAYDSDRDRVYFTSQSTGSQALLRWFDLENGGCRIDLPSSDLNACPLSALDLFPFVRGADLRGIALSHVIPGQPRRAYIAARVFDADVASQIGGRPTTDVAGVLLVVELDDGADGRVHPRLVNWVDAGIGVSEVAVLPQRPASACAAAAGCRDLVAVTAGDAGLVSIYDDEVGDMRRVFGRVPVTGEPVLGLFPYGLAVASLASLGTAAQPATSVPACQTAPDACARVYVSSFQDNWVSAVDVPLADPGSAGVVMNGNLPWTIGATP